MTNPIVIVHAGAGTFNENDSEYIKALKDSCRKACIIAMDKMKNQNISAIEAVCESISIFEQDDVSNAGRGSNLDLRGQVSCDASIMDDEGYSGSVGSLQEILNPIKVAKEILKEQKRYFSKDLYGPIPPMILVGNGAQEFAIQNGHVKTSLVTDNTIQQYKIFAEKKKSRESELDYRMDTVGAICIDTQGRISAGCSSGGILLKYPGRIGHASIYGAGCFVSNKDSKDESMKSACITSGLGEYIIREQLAKSLCNNISRELSIDECQELLIEFMNNKTNTSIDDRERFGALLLVKNSLERDTDIPNHSRYECWTLFNTKHFCTGIMQSNDKSPKIKIMSLGSLPFSVSLNGI